METNKQMMSNENIMTIRVSEKEFDSNLRFVSKIAEEAKNKGKSILFRKIDNKLVMCSGGIKSSVAMVAIDVEGGPGECKGFINGKEVIERLSKARGMSDLLEIHFDISNSCIMLKNEKGRLAIAFDVIKDVAEASDEEAVVAKYRNEIVEKAYRVVRDVESRGIIQLKYKDFIDLEKSLKNTAYAVGNNTCVEFRFFKEVQKVRKKVIDPNTKSDIIQLVDEEFPILEGIGSQGSSMGISRKYGTGIGLPNNAGEVKVLVASDLLSHVSSAISAIKDEPVKISRGLEEMCISAGKAKFIFPVTDSPVEDVRMYFNVPSKWKIEVDATELREVVELLGYYLDQGSKIGNVQMPNKTIVMPGKKMIAFIGVGRDGLPVERYIKYNMSTDINGNVYKDFEINEIPLNLHRKYIREFMESYKGKKVSFGIHTYPARRKKIGPDRQFVRDANGNEVMEEYEGRLISIEDSEQGIYGVHHRIKI